MLEYRSERMSSRLQINLCIIKDRKFKITLCFPSEDWHVAFEERECIEDLLEKRTF